MTRGAQGSMRRRSVIAGSAGACADPACGRMIHAAINERGRRMTASAPTASKVELTIDSGVATIALNRPEVRNAIDDEMRAQFNAVVERIANDDAVRAV